MKVQLSIILLLATGTALHAQKTAMPSAEDPLGAVVGSTCTCIDSINAYEKPKNETLQKINKCLEDAMGAYQLTKQLFAADTAANTVNKAANTVNKKNGKKVINISINSNKESAEYKSDYFELERKLMSGCPALSKKLAANSKQSKRSFSENQESLDFYNKGQAESEKENFEAAIGLYKKALAIDSQFAFAWDNLGIAYRRVGNYDKSLDAYQRSLEIDPEGLMPLQNIAVVYQYKKEYQKAIDAYERCAAIDSTNPEVFYGLGQIYSLYLANYEKGLDYMCDAYNIYFAQKPPYRTDAEKLIQIIYTELKKQGREDYFKSTLKKHNINANL